MDTAEVRSPLPRIRPLLRRWRATGRAPDVDLGHDLPRGRRREREVPELSLDYKVVPILCRRTVSLAIFTTLFRGFADGTWLGPCWPETWDRCDSAGTRRRRLFVIAGTMARSSGGGGSARDVAVPAAMVAAFAIVPFDALAYTLSRLSTQPRHDPSGGLAFAGLGCRGRTSVLVDPVWDPGHPVRYSAAWQQGLLLAFFLVRRVRMIGLAAADRDRGTTE